MVFLLTVYADKNYTAEQIQQYLNEKLDLSPKKSKKVKIKEISIEKWEGFN